MTAMDRLGRAGSEAVFERRGNVEHPHCHGGVSCERVVYVDGSLTARVGERCAPRSQ